MQEFTFGRGDAKNMMMCMCVCVVCACVRICGRGEERNQEEVCMIYRIESHFEIWLEGNSRALPLSPIL